MIPNFQIKVKKTASSQICGMGHYRMLAYTLVKTPEEFKKWMSEKNAEQGGLHHAVRQ